MACRLRHIPLCLQTWGITHLYFEKDTEPYANERDGQVREAAGKANIQVETPVSHTLYVSPSVPLPLITVSGRLSDDCPRTLD